MPLYICRRWEGLAIAREGLRHDVGQVRTALTAIHDRQFDRLALELHGVAA